MKWFLNCLLNFLWRKKPFSGFNWGKGQFVVYIQPPTPASLNLFKIQESKNLTRMMTTKNKKEKKKKKILTDKNKHSLGMCFFLFLFIYNKCVCRFLSKNKKNRLQIQNRLFIYNF